MAELSEDQKTVLPAWELGLFAPSVSQLTPAETIALVSKMGYRWVEWRVQTLQAIESSPWGKAYNTLTLDNLVEEARQVASLLENTPVKTTALQVDAPEDFAGLVPVVLAAARALNCPRVGLSEPCYDPCQGYRAQRDAFRVALAKWVDLFEGTGIRLCVETHFGSITPGAALAMDMLQPFTPGQVGVMWDPANMVCEGYELPVMALDLLGPYLAEVHLKNGAWNREEDGKWNFSFCDLSQGMLHWPAVLKLLHAQAYRGPLVVEDYRWMDPEAKLAAARQEYEKAFAQAFESE